MREVIRPLPLFPYENKNAEAAKTNPFLLLFLKSNILHDVEEAVSGCMVKMPTLTTKDAVAVGADAHNNRRTRCVPCLIAADMCSTSSQFSTLLIYCFSARVAIPVDEDFWL